MIVLLGPTGETARRILAIARSGGIDLRLAAREPSRAREQLGPLCDGLTINAVDALDADSVEAMLGAGDVLINAATPSGQLGYGLARAAINAGAHYVAFTGEVVDTLNLFREFDAPARERGVSLCPGAGSSGGIGDAALRLALRKLPEARSGYIGSAITDFTASFGTLVSEMHIMNGPAVIVRGGQLVEEQLSGRVYRRDGITFVERPLIDPLMCWTYSGLDFLGAGIEVPEEKADEMSTLFRKTADALSSESGRAAYLEQIAESAGDHVPENAQSAEGTRTAIVWNDYETAKVVVSARPVYEATARAALLVACELAERSDCPAGFQALTSIARSTEYALEALGSRVL